MDDRQKCFMHYFEKINVFVNCLKSKKWIATADEKALDRIFYCAFEIEEILLKKESKTLKMVVENFHSEFDFRQCGDEVLKALLLHPEANERMMLHGTKRYLTGYSKSRLVGLLNMMVHDENMKENSLHLIKMLSYKENVKKMLEAKSTIYLWEAMIAENNENFEETVINFFQDRAPLFLYCLYISPEKTGRIILNVLLKFLNCNPDFRMWFALLSKKTIKTTSLLCAQYPVFLKGLLGFFSKYASECDCREGETSRWIYNRFSLYRFVDILKFLLVNDGKVGVAVNEFINREINNFDKNYSFWIDIKAMLM